MAEQQRFDRMLRMLMLLSGGTKFTITELSEKLLITRRTVYRNISTFRDAGFIITQSGGYYQIDRQSPYLKSLHDLLHFTREESWILNKAILALDDDSVIKQNLARKLYYLYDIKGVPYPVVKKEQSEKIVALIRAMDEKKQVCFQDYHSPNSKTIRDRIVEPCEFTLNYNYIWCFDTHDLPYFCPNRSSMVFRLARNFPKFTYIL